MELALDPGSSDITLPQPWSCSPTWKWPRWSPLPGSPGALVGLFLQPRCLSSTGHTRGTWPGLWWSRGAP